MRSRRRAILTAILLVAASDPVFGQGAGLAAGDGPITDERAALGRALDDKRNATLITDWVVPSGPLQMPEATIPESLQRLPGIQIERDGGIGNTVRIRGLLQNITLLDGDEFLTGLEAYPAGQHTTQSLEGVPTALVSLIDIVKAPSAAMIEGGLGGIINLKTASPLDAREGLALAARIGARHGDSGDTGWRPDDALSGSYNWHYVIGLTATLVDQDTTGRITAGSPPATPAGSLDTVTRDESRKEVSGTVNAAWAATESLTVAAGWLHNRNDIGIARATPGDPGSIGAEANLARLRIDWDGGGAWRAGLRAAYADSRYQTQDASSPQPNPLRPDSTIDDVTVRGDLAWDLSALPLKTTLTGGFRLADKSVDAFASASGFVIDDRSAAGYLMADSGESTDRLHLNGGIRIVQTTQTIAGREAPIIVSALPAAAILPPWRVDTEWLPDLNVVFDLAASQKLRVGAARVMAPANPFELGGSLGLLAAVTDGTLGRRAGAVGAGNPGLAPERATQAEVAYSVTLDHHGSVGASLYDKAIDRFTSDRAATVCPAAGGDCGPATLPVNARGAAVRGAEASMTYLWDQGLGVDLNYSYTQAARGTAIADNAPAVLPGIARHALTAQVYGAVGGLDARLSYSWRSGLSIGDDESVAHRSYGQLDGQITYALDERAKLVAHLINLSDSVERASMTGTVFPLMAAGRAFLVALVVQR